MGSTTLNLYKPRRGGGGHGGGGGGGGGGLAKAQLPAFVADGAVPPPHARQARGVAQV
jgi:hypothetical protein